MRNNPSRSLSRTPPPRFTSRSQERDAGEREKRKRQQFSLDTHKSNSGAVVASGSVGGGWHITTNSRCIACGRLGDSCECRGTRMDPHLKRLKVDSLLLNTPHGRCKQIKAIEETGRDEARHRSRIIDQWTEGMRCIRNAALTGWKLLLLEQDESAARGFILANERKERAQGMTLANRFIVLVAVSQHEREARVRHFTSAQREAQHLMDWHTAEMDFLVLLSREEAYRSALCSQEAAARAALESYDVEFLNLLDANERARRILIDAFLEERELVVEEWRRGVDVLRDMIEDSANDISLKLLERTRFGAQCEQQKMQLCAAEGEERRRLKDEMIKEGNRIMEMVQVFEQQRDDVVRHEASARNAIVDNVASVYHTLFLAFKRNEEEARDVEELKRQRRESELHMAVHCLSSIVEEEAADFAAIIAMERREKDQRYQWMLEKATRQRELEHRCVHAYRSLRDEEQHERHALFVAMQESEAAVGEWLQKRGRLLRELDDLAVEQKSALRVAEHEARFALTARKAESEDLLRHWAEERRAARATVAAAEAAHRTSISESERTARERIVWAAAAAAEQFHAAALVREDLMRSALAAGAAIAAEEARAVEYLRAHAADDYARALGASRHRGLAELWRCETAARSLVAQAEVRHRESAVTQLLLERAALEREALERSVARLCELEAAESRERALLADAALRGLREAQREAAEARDGALRRQRDERRARETALAEDRRLYDPAEPLADAAPDAAAELRGALVLRALGAEAAEPVALPPAAAALLARVVDAVAQSGAEACEERRRAQAAAEDAERRVEAQRQALASAKERRAEGKKKMERDAAEHEVRAASDRAARLRDDTQLERERARLKEKVEKLRAVQEEVASVREAIHKQYQRR